jgi:hypothetical protein
MPSPLSAARHFRCSGCRLAAGTLNPSAYLLPRDELFSPLPRLVALVLPLARSLCARLFCVLALPPLLAACARLPLPRLEEDDDLEVRGAIDISCSDVVRPAHHARDHTVTLGAAPWLSVGCVCTSM